MSNNLVWNKVNSAISPQNRLIRPQLINELKQIVNASNAEILNWAPTRKDQKEKTALYIAVEKNDLDVVKILLTAREIDINKGYKGKTPLWIAVRNNNPEIVSELLLKKANPNITDRNGKTPLTIARHKGFVDIVKMLDGETTRLENNRIAAGPALWEAVENNNIEEVSKLCDLYKNDSSVINFSSDVFRHYGQTLLIRAIVNKNEAMAERLISCPSIDINKEDGCGGTPLWVAVFKHIPNIVKKLFEKTQQMITPNIKKISKSFSNLFTYQNALDTAKPLLNYYDKNPVELAEFMYSQTSIIEVKKKEELTEILTIFGKTVGWFGNVKNAGGRRRMSRRKSIRSKNKTFRRR